MVLLFSMLAAKREKKKVQWIDKSKKKGKKGNICFVASNISCIIDSGFLFNSSLSLFMVLYGKMKGFA